MAERKPLNMKPGSHGQNYKNQLDCYISAHRHLKWCGDVLREEATNRYDNIRKAADERSAMHAKRNAERRARKERLNG